MQNKLIELLIQCDEQNHDVRSGAELSPSSSIKEIAEFLTSYIVRPTDGLLANGVIVPPCKVGDTVYCIIKGFSGVMRGRVCSFILTDKKTTIHCAIDGYFGQDFPYCEFGKTVFLTLEEAEQALKMWEK